VAIGSIFPSGTQTAGIGPLPAGSPTSGGESSPPQIPAGSEATGGDRNSKCACECRCVYVGSDPLEILPPDSHPAAGTPAASSVAVSPRSVELLSRTTGGVLEAPESRTAAGLLAPQGFGFEEPRLLIERALMAANDERRGHVGATVETYDLSTVPVARWLEDEVGFRFGSAAQGRRTISSQAGTDSPPSRRLGDSPVRGPRRTGRSMRTGISTPSPRQRSTASLAPPHYPSVPGRTSAGGDPTLGSREVVSAPPSHSAGSGGIVEPPEFQVGGHSDA